MEPLWKVTAELPASVGDREVAGGGVFKTVNLLVAQDDLVPLLRTLIWSGARVIDLVRD